MKISKAKFEMALARLGALYGRGMKKRLASQLRVTQVTMARYVRKINAGEDFEADLVGRIAKGIAELLCEPLDVPGLALPEPEPVGADSESEHAEVA